MLRKRSKTHDSRQCMPPKKTRGAKAKTGAMASGEPAVADLVKMMVEDRKRWEAELEKREKALETERARREEELAVEREAYLKTFERREWRREGERTWRQKPKG